MSENNTLSQAPGDRYRAYLESGELHLQVCGDCSRQIFYPRTICPYCGSNALEWAQASGSGTVYSTTTVRRRPERGGDYNISIIELAEGARMLSRVEGVPPQDIHIGMAVSAVISEAEDTWLVVFKPVGED